jgi:hypothetical protein
MFLVLLLLVPVIFLFFGTGGPRDPGQGRDQPPDPGRQHRSPYQRSLQRGQIWISCHIKSDVTIEELHLIFLFYPDRFVCLNCKPRSYPRKIFIE